MTKDEALKLALEALEMCEVPWTGTLDHNLTEAITAIKEALANDALEKKAENARELGLNYEPEVFSKQNYLNGYCVGQSDLLAEQAKQEPVAWITEWESQYSSGKILDYIAHTRGEKVEYTPLYTTPSKRTWVGLTDEEVKQLCLAVGTEPIEVRLIEAKLKEKNT